MDKLFQPINIGTMTLNNRITFAPFTTDFASAKGAVTDQLVAFYQRRAEGGTGLIVTENFGVSKLYSFGAAINDDSLMPGLSRLANAIKAAGAKAAIQLSQQGQHVSSRVTGFQARGPSEIRSRTTGEICRELTIGEVEELIDEFAQAARRAREAGFDAIQVMGAHQQLIGQFFSPYTNKRQDKYGKDTYGRARFALEIIDRIRSEQGKDFPVILRLSANEYINGGLELEEAKIIAHLVEEAGADAISVSAGGWGSLTGMLIPSMFIPRGCFVPLAVGIKEVVGIPIIVVGRIDSAAQAEKILDDGEADLIAMCRALVADPDLPRKSLEGRQREVRHCICCNICLDCLAKQRQARCAMNPEVGFEAYTESKADRSRKVLVIGASPDGLEFARVAKQRGHDVVLWHEEKTIGGRWSWLIKPAVTYRSSLLTKEGIPVELGREVTADSIRELDPDVVVFTKGLKPPAIQYPGLEKVSALSARDVLDKKIEVGHRVVIIGGGNVGLELAEYLHRREADVTILEQGTRLTYGLELFLALQLLERLTKRGVKTQTQVKIQDITEGKITALIDDKQEIIEFDDIIIAQDWLVDDSLPQYLTGGDYDIFTLEPCQRPTRFITSLEEGAELARKI